MSSMKHFNIQSLPRQKTEEPNNSLYYFTSVATGDDGWPEIIHQEETDASDK